MIQSKSNEFLGTAPLPKLLLKMAMPAVIAQLINMLYNLVDRIYIGHIPDTGSLALTGMGVCLPVIMLISAFGALVSMGFAPRSSISMGKGDYKTGEKLLGNGLTLLIIFSAVLTTVLLIFGKDILLLFGASDQTIGYANDYMSIYAIGTIFVLITLGLNAFITSQGFSVLSMLTVMIGAGFNIILDPIFIFVFDMGVKGAATATIISQGLSCLWVLIFLTGKKTLLKIRWKNMLLQKAIVLPSLALGLSPFIMQSTESLVLICFNSSLLRYGGDMAVGAMTILSSIMMFSILPLQGLGQGAQPIAGYNYGAGNGARLKKTFFLLLICNLIFATSIWLLVMLCPKALVGIFTSDPSLIDYSARMLKIYMACSQIMGIQTACQMILIATDKPISSMVVALLRKVILLIPLIYILPMIIVQQDMAIFLAEPIADFVSVVCASLIFSLSLKKTLANMQREKIDNGGTAEKTEINQSDDKEQ